MRTRVWNGALLRQARLRRGWSQDQLARALRIGVTNVSRWERGQHRPGADMIPALAGALDVEEGFFFGEQEQGDDEDEEAALRRVATDFAGLFVSEVRRVREKSQAKEIA